MVNTSAIVAAAPVWYVIYSSYQCCVTLKHYMGVGLVTMHRRRFLGDLRVTCDLSPYCGRACAA